MRYVGVAMRRYGDLILALGLSALGLVRAITSYRLDFNLGDPSTFFIFSRNTAMGEVIYKDFIHFRMPGFYYYCAAFIRTFGDTFASVYLATRIEGYVLFPLVMFASTRLITRSSGLATMAGVACVLTSGIFQLRAGLGLLAVALYVAALRHKQHQGRWLLASGLVLGLDFIEGQEIFLFACAAIGIGEVIMGWPAWRLAIARLRRMAMGASIVILPFLGFIALFSDFKNFLYYAFYYALILQPKYMNLPFPAPSLDNLMYYVPFGLYLGVIALFWCTRRLTKEAVIVVSFGILRLASALGRADLAHLLFSIPELFFIVPWALAGLRSSDWRRPARRLWMALAGLSLVFALATVKSAALLLAPVLLAVLYAWSRHVVVAAAPSARAFRASSLVGAAIIAIIFHSSLVQAYQDMRDSVHYVRHGMPANTISGVVVKEPQFTEVTRVSAAVTTLRPKHLFSYPIEPFYYSVAGEHASRFITFEPQTTPAEVDQAIADLERTRPEAVVFDMIQAETLSPSLSRLSDYLTSNYDTQQVVSVNNYIKIMKVRSQPALRRSLVLDLYATNTKSAGLTTYHLQAADGHITDTFKTARAAAKFPLKLTEPAVLDVAVAALPGATGTAPVCGDIMISARGATHTQRVCSTSEPMHVDLAPYMGLDATLTLKPAGNVPVLWIDPIIRAAFRS